MVTAGCSSAVAGRATATAAAPTSSARTSAGTTPGAAESSATPSVGSSANSDQSATGGTVDSPDPGGPFEIDGATGALGGTDPYYPDSGNGGYDVASYDVTFTFDPETQNFSASTMISATVTEKERLGRFSFDLQNSLTVSAVTVNDGPASFTQEGAKLIITPKIGVDTGEKLMVVAQYAGTPTVIGGGTTNLGDGGWYTLDSGGAIVIGEPYSSSAWFPSNEVPSDKATFQVTGTIPQGWEMISNGSPFEGALPPAPPGFKSERWTENSQMATYLTTLYIDTFSMTSDTTTSGIPIINAYATGAEEFKELGDKTGQYLAFLETLYGPYPFKTSGGIYTGESIGFALENQTRPVYPNWVDESTVVHELAHQWYGDSVSVENWSDVCLNECFASYASWQYDEFANNWDLDRTYLFQIDEYKDEPGFWALPLVDMGAGNEFSDVYSRGPLALHALRAEMGADAFSTLLKDWVSEHGGGNANWSQFEEKVNQVAGRDLSGFMKAWFRDTGVPADEYLYPGDLQE